MIQWISDTLTDPNLQWAQSQATLVKGILGHAKIGRGGFVHFRSALVRLGKGIEAFNCFPETQENSGSCHKRQKAQAPTPRAPIRNRQTRKVANAEGLYRYTNLT